MTSCPETSVGCYWNGFGRCAHKRKWPAGWEGGKGTLRRELHRTAVSPVGYLPDVGRWRYPTRRLRPEGPTIELNRDTDSPPYPPEQTVKALVDRLSLSPCSPNPPRARRKSPPTSRSTNWRKDPCEV